MHTYLKNTLLFTFLVLVAGTAINGQPAQAEKIDVDIQLRVKQLEAQLLKLKAEIENLKKPQAMLDSEQEATQEPANVARNAKKETVADTKGGSGDKSLTINAGDLKITPYGIIFFNAFANSGGTNNTDDPLWATSGGVGNASASVRQTRFGLRFEGGRLGNANIKGVVEADFYGGFPAVGVGETMGVVRLRLANVRFEWEKTSLLIGQDWIIFAPNSPTSLAAQAIPQFAAAGNPWSRLPQVRIEQKLGKNLLWQGAILAPGTGDFPSGSNTPALLQPGSGATSQIPFFQSRVSFTGGNWFGTKGPGTIGLAGHFGRSRATNGFATEDLNSYGLAVDWKFPIFKRVNAIGEAFWGENLGGFQAGVFQGFNSDFGSPWANSLGTVPGGIRAIGTRGGWIQLGWNLPVLKDRLSMYGSFGIDDPRNSDLISIGNRNFRSRNLGYAYDLIYVFNPQFSVGGEFRRLETSYFLANRESSNHLNFGAKYSF